MAAKDITEKLLENFNDVFADIVNVLVFGGERRVQEDDLTPDMERSDYRTEDGIAEQERDAKKKWQNGKLCIAMLGFENQTSEDADFVFRDIGYDGAEYRDQVRRRDEIRRANNKKLREAGDADFVKLEKVPEFYPVVTLVLYFGEKPWKGSLHLKGHLKIPDGLEEYVSDYTVNLFEIAHLPDEKVQEFTSDFRYVAEYFVASRKRKEGQEVSFEVTVDHIKHVEEFADLMNALTNSKKFSSFPKLARGKEGGSMWTILFDEAEERGANKLVRLLRMVEPGSTEYYEILDADEAKREELYRRYGIVEDEEKKAVALQA